MRWLIAAIVAWAGVAHAGDPTRVYHTIESEHFVIYYYDPLGDVARRIAVVGENAHRTLAAAIDHHPGQRTIIVLEDDTDSANGFASVLPRNAVSLFATAPPAISELDDYDDWLHGLISHEYTHILHLDTILGIPNIYNHVVGKIWSPNQNQPRWIIEGVATYEESKRTAGGRDHGTRFDQFIRQMKLANEQLRLDEVTGAPRKFPRGNAIYVYGSHFLGYIFDRFGDDTMRQMTVTGGGHPVPFGINRQISKVTGRPFTELYDDWQSYLRDRYALQTMAAERRGLVVGRQLTHTGNNNINPEYTLDGKEIVWQEADGYDRPRVRAMPSGGDARLARDVIGQIDAMGPFDLLPDGSFVYEQGRLYRREYSYQDLFRHDVRDKDTTQDIRLTVGRRARDPSVSPDGRRIAFSMNEHSESCIAVMDAAPDAPHTIVWHGDRYDQAYQPAWSPDGKRIAFSAWRKGGRRDILVVEIASGKVLAITNDRAIEMSPAWSHDGRYVYFASDRTGIENIFAYDTGDRSLWQVTNVLGGAYHPSPSPDGKSLAFEAAVPAGGEDIFELPLDPATWLPARDYIDSKPQARVIRDDEAVVSAPRPYRPLETLAPQSYSVQLALTQADPIASLQTGGADAVGIHSYQVDLDANLSTGDLNIGGVYAYNRLRPGLRFAAARTIAERGGFKVDGVSEPFKQETWSGTVSASVPFESRPESTWSLSLDYDVDWFRLAQSPMQLPPDPDPNMRLPGRPLTDYVQAGVAVRVGYSSVRSVTYGIGGQYGFDTSLSARLDHPALGATYSNVTVSYSADVYRRLWGKTPVISARLGGSFRAGDLVRPGSFALGGVPGQDVVQSIIDSTRTGVVGYLRGYPVRTIQGNQFHLLNVEYRQELFQIEHGLATLPIYVRRVTIAGLADAATAYDGSFDASRDLRYSVGGALRLDTLLGYFAPGTFEIGYAHGLTKQGIDETWLLLTGSL